ncbi:DUF2806 domain-containing protein [Lysinibacillus agricola]|uniref:DUF2806 domain-containing protein n=1 Tax=Lysinibacillus agricola TaxID=2590012 RepID=A0ABX7AQV9_9BACI|nr:MULTISPECIES: DUF2806 domain-containing protein [Lysinibacillus]QQP11672.1 DUF2806 domain-containing protein [Lysinibacillus agricola]
MTGSNGFNIGDLVGLSEPLTKLIEVVSCGLGKIYEPTNIRRTAKAKADEIKLISDALVQNNMLPTNYSNGDISIDTTNSEELFKRAGERMIYQEILKQQNIDSVINTAFDELENTDEVSEDPVDKDWITRFMNSIEDISNEYMQEIWGKLLAGEIKQPNTFSLRTLEKLKNLTQHEAVLFKKVSEIALIDGNTSHIYRGGDLLDSVGINYDDLLVMEECGLITTAELTYSINVKPNFKITLSNEERFASFYNTSESSKIIEIPVYKITYSGTQLLKVIQSNPDNDFFISCIGELGMKNSQDFSINIYPITGL